VSDDSDGPIVISDTPLNISPQRARRRKARLEKMDLSLSSSSLNLDFTDCPTRIAKEDLCNRNVDDLAGVVDGWLGDMELARSKSKNLNGRISGCLKDRISCIRSVIKNLVDRVKDTGDVTYLRRRNDELASQLRESKREEDRLQSFLKEADLKIEKLNGEIYDLRRRIGSRSLTADSLEKSSHLAKSGSDTPNTPVTSRKNTSRKKIAQERQSPIVESLQALDDQLTAISKFEEKITSFQELLRSMRAELYGSTEVISDKVNRTASLADPPKRAVPKIISNIQLVPPRSAPEQVTGSRREDSDQFLDLEGWTEIISKKDKRRQAGTNATKECPESAGRVPGTAGNARPERRMGPPGFSSGTRKRPPKNAAVTIKTNPVLHMPRLFARLER